MSENIIKKTLTRGVGRRIFGLFLVAALIPMVFATWLASHEFDKGLAQAAERSLRSNAKEYGVEILTRLQTATTKGREIARIARETGLASIYEHDYLVSDFETVWVVRDNNEEGIEISTDDVAFLAAGGSKLILTPHGKLVVLQAVGDWVPGGLMAFQLNAEKIWGPRENLPLDTDFCVFSEAGRQLFCTSGIDAGVHSSLVGDSDGRTGLFGEWEHDGVSQYAALWQLFLGAEFAAPAFDIVAVQPEALTMQSVTDFRRILIPAVALILILVALLSLHFIGRSLIPLQHLTIASRQIAGGNLDSRVRIRTGDEFEWLAEAFNNMAGRLSRQISALKAMSGIDRMILAGSRFEDVSEDVVRHLIDLMHCQSAAVIACDINDPSHGKMVSLYRDDIFQERVSLPVAAGHEWCQPRQVDLAAVDSDTAPYKARFEEFGQNSVVLVPVVLKHELKGVLLLGFDSRFEMSKVGLQGVADLAGRFAVALSSVEREEVLYRQANFDPLTNLPNRQLLKERLERQIASARDDDRNGAVLFLDLDRFKEINDIYGHSVGDVVLLQAAKRIISEVRDRDTVARLGGDEFVVILPSVQDESVVRATAERLLEKLAEAFTVNDVDHYVGASIGIVLFPDDGDSVETLLKNADAAMYRAKDAGRNRFEFFSERLNAESRRRIGLERDLRDAFRNNSLEVYYQPQFDMRTGALSGAEALLRWEHPEHGAISPTEFIPLAEESGLIVDIGAWVIEQTCADLCQILDLGLHPGPVSINVSPRQLREGDFRTDVMDTVRRFGIHPGYLQLEVTETAVAQNRDTAIALLESLRIEGVRVAIDDFGTGYSSLSYLQQMPFDVIKIDKSFVDKIGSNETSDNICRTVIRMAEELGKKSIAEGVELAEQVDFLRKFGCNLAQGYFYSPAMPFDEFLEYIEKQDAHTQRRKALEIL